MRIGITGHQAMPAAARDLVAKRLRQFLVELAAEQVAKRSAGQAAGQLVGYSSLAVGSDQLFADCLLAAGGRLVAVIPSQHYETTFSRQDLPAYASLLERATEVITLDENPEPAEQAFMAAGQRVVEAIDLLVAVWDGQPARGLGGTADVVWYAWERGIPVLNLWPKGMSR